MEGPRFWTAERTIGMLSWSDIEDMIGLRIVESHRYVV